MHVWLLKEVSLVEALGQHHLSLELIERISICLALEDDNDNNLDEVVVELCDYMKQLAVVPFIGYHHCHLLWLKIIH